MVGLLDFLMPMVGFKIRYTEKVMSDDNLKIVRKGRIEVRIALEQRKFLDLMPYKYIMEMIQIFFNISSELRTSLRSDIIIKNTG